MIEKIIIAGSGGQGIILMGKVLAEAAMRIDKFVTWLPVYGAEVRGGTAHCMVIISDEEIGSPYINKADTLIIMNEPSWHKFKDRIKNNGSYIINSSLVKNIKVPIKTGQRKIRKLQGNFTDIAISLGNIKVANMVALGCYIAEKRVIERKNLFAVIEDIAPLDKKDLIEINKKALSVGIELLRPNS